MNHVTSMKCENITEEIIQDYRKKGFELVFQEYVMEHPLTEIPQTEISSPYQSGGGRELLQN
ncbi:hypothetical protein FGG79_11950 [Bacillus sp. BHET2]|uniref:hypothetical protein n=1 Tax=Bacillus sp. BHET2 TaxID=2583818 RepID=UPI00110DB6E7|nr:hypothetical protein [Bacillus sp. BHET2]TMU85900.1 hypothetical protein FGG79_11950 [Bacillus sp. BHET2]